MILPEKLTTTISELKTRKGCLIMVLHAVQEHYGYVPQNVCFQLSKELGIPIARMYEVLTFYNFFRLETPAKYKISVCMGTACYLKGAPAILETIKNKLKIKEGETSQDKLFRLEVARCYGCCGLAPVVMINGQIFSNVTTEKIHNIIDECALEGSKND